MDLSQNEKDQLESIGADALILFGSQAQGIANKNSDYDLFVIGKKSQKIYDAVYDIISEKMDTPRDIDIVFESDSPMELQNHVIKYGKILYQKDNSIFPDFKQKVMTIYADFAPHRQVYSSATLSRI